MKKRGLKLAAVVMALAMVPAVAFAAGSKVTDRDNSNTTSSTDNTFSGGTSSTGTVTQGNGQVVGTMTTTTTTTASTVSQGSNVITAGNGETVSATATSTQTTATGESVTTGSVSDVTTENGSKITYAGNATVTIADTTGVATNVKVLSGSEINTADVSAELSTLRQAVTAGTSTDAATASVKAQGFQSTGITESVFLTDATSNVEVQRNTEYGYVCAGLRADAQVSVVFVNNNGTTQVLSVRRVGDILYFVLPASGQITIYTK
ncbi:hypothetical protein AAAY25_04475 [Brotaphodocola catenula]|uniref:Uncharacterized protein n=1 Tax=Brotaphodocola catenula TaxID=2885361 RepID=A0AAE3DLB7_9FIRM|nr:hypothetical protein [Brotaphodocola catenula]MCC2164868.1 hypothetical protein [Brotaphodocola catenula]